MATGKYGSASAWIFVDGFDLRATKIQTLSHKIESLTEPSHGIGDDHEEHSPQGIQRFTLTQAGAFYDTTTGSSHDALATHLPTTVQAASRVVCVGFAGQTIGEFFYGLSGTFTMVYEVLTANAALTKANVEYKVVGSLDRGSIVQPLAAKTVDWNTKSLGTVVDYTLDPSQVVIPITSNSIANPTVVTTTIPHGYATGDIVFIAGNITSNPSINGERTVTVTSTTTFTIPVNVTTGGTGGTIVRS